MRRLLSFDYVIEHPDLPWLPTEAEKVAAFEAVDIGRPAMPVRVYRGAAGGARRYFPRGMPVALDTRRAVFVHADPGWDTSTALRSWRDRHLKLWEALRELGLSVEVAGVACARRPLERARTILGNWTHADTDARPVQSARNRRCGPARDHADRERHPRHGRRGGRGNGRLPGLPPANRRDEGTAPIGPPRRNDRRPFGMAFEPPRRRRDLTARGHGPLPIRKCTLTSGSLCTGNALGRDTPPMPQVAGVVAFVPPPQRRRVTRGRLRPLTGATHGVRHASHATAAVGMCKAIPPLASGRSRSSSPMREGDRALAVNRKSVAEPSCYWPVIPRPRAIVATGERLGR